MVLFVITGYLVWYAFRHTATELSRAVNQKTPILMFPQVTVLDTIVARAMLAWFTYMGVMTVLAGGAVFITQYPPPKDVALMMFAIFIGLWLGGAVGILMGVSMRYIPALSYFYQGALRAGPFVSGAIFTADELPQWLHPYLAWNPIFHACELIRTAWVPSFVSPIANIHYPIICGLLATVAALLTERATRHFKFS
jgi:capsular polysaccharide transport system permease protein